MIKLCNLDVTFVTWKQKLQITTLRAFISCIRYALSVYFIVTYFEIYPPYIKNLVKLSQITKLRGYKKTTEYEVT